MWMHYTLDLFGNKYPSRLSSKGLQFIHLAGMICALAIYQAAVRK